VLFDFCNAIRFNPTIDIDACFSKEYFFHLCDIVGVNQPEPILSEYFEFLEIFVAFLHKKKVIYLSVDLSYVVMNGSFKAWYFGHFIDNPDVLHYCSLILKLMDRLSNNYKYSIFNAIEWITHDAIDEFRWLEVVDIVEFVLHIVK